MKPRPAFANVVGLRRSSFCKSDVSVSKIPKHAFTWYRVPGNSNPVVFGALHRRNKLRASDGSFSQQTKGDVLVVGAGVIGITTAIRLREAGYSVIVAASETPTTILKREKSELSGKPEGIYTSSGSGGFWMPFYANGERLKQWCLSTYDVLEADANASKPGVSMHDGFILYYEKLPDELPFYGERSSMVSVTSADDERVPSAYAGALRMTVPIVVMDDYLPYLEEYMLSIGVELRIAELTMASATDLALKTGRDVIVNCTGVGSASFSEDSTVSPGRGVTVRVRRPSSAPNYFITESEGDGLLSRDGLLAYCLPRGAEYTLGGTIFKDDWRTHTGAAEAEGVLQRCATLLPGVDKWERTSVWSGLRPLRTGGIRLEVQEDGDGTPIVANYGHGGSGVTSCWGCASAVVEIIDGVIARK